MTAVLQQMKEQRRRQQKEEAETLHPMRFRDEAEYRRRKGQPNPQPSTPPSTDVNAAQGKGAMEEEVKDEALEAPAAKWARIAAAGTKQPAVATSKASASSSASSSSSTAAVLPPSPLAESSSVAELASPELALENAVLLDSLSSDLDALHVAESKANEVAQLLSLFHSRVLQQSEQIDRIEDNTISSIALVERGVEQLRKAASKGASFRIMVLFMILVLSFSLLFLDYLYP